ncbi:MAG: hypothetical protein QME52_04360 [Bacteroidota bacterium]|nr:hypothetical protein [Bacteroidota bacterium]
MNFLTNIAKDFLFAGSSALLLLAANFYAEYWYLSLFALIPFLLYNERAPPMNSENYLR